MDWLGCQNLLLRNRSHETIKLMRKETKRQCVQEGGRQEGEGDKEVLRK